VEDNHGKKMVSVWGFPLFSEVALVIMAASKLGTRGGETVSILPYATFCLMPMVSKAGSTRPRGHKGKKPEKKVSRGETEHRVYKDESRGAFTGGE